MEGVRVIKTVFEACTPRDDVLRGALTEDTFAADLQAVANKTAPPVYSDANQFFASSYPTAGLRTLAAEVFNRFSEGAYSSPVLRLETSFGGGKTHNLIALWHMATSPEAVESAGWMPEVSLPKAPICVVPLSCDKYGADEVARHGQVVTRTLWGEAAWQLGNYESMRTSDEERLAPSEGALDSLMKDKQVLILLDEFAAYLRGAKGKRVGGGTLADQSLRYFHMLLGYAASHANLVVVYTLAESTDAYATETGAVVEQVRESRVISARQERVITPTSETEIAEILKRRLFRKIDSAAACEIAEDYSRCLAKALEQGASLPTEVADISYRQRLEMSYPFHPEFVGTLYRKTASISSFQRTRGVLRLLAAVTRCLFDKKPPDTYLIQSTDIDLSEPSIRNDLTSRLDRARLDVAVSSDIWSEHGNAHAQEIDRDWLAKGYPGLCTRVAQAVFLHSLVAGRDTMLGAEPSEILLASLRPELPFDLVEKALEQIDKKFWYADYDGKRYFFKEEPTLKKLIEDAASNVGTLEAKDAIRKKIREVFAGSVFNQPVFFPSGPQDVPDDSGRPGLVVLDFDHLAFSATDSEIPKVVEDVFRQAGEDLGFRKYQNNLVILACDENERDRLVEVAKRFKGIEGLNRSEAVKQQLPRAKVKDLKSSEDEAGLEYLVAVTNAYKHLFFPSTTTGGVEHYQLPPQDTNGAKRQQQTVLRAKLIELKQALADIDQKLAPEYVRDKVWTSEDDITTLELERSFRRKQRVYMLFDTEPLKETIKVGVASGVWVYHDGQVAYRKQNPPLVSAIRFDSQCALLTVTRADALYPQSKPEDVRIEPPGGWTRAGGGEGEARDVPKRNLTFEYTGPVAKAFTGVLDQLKDAGICEIRVLILDFTGVGNTTAFMYAWPAFITVGGDLSVSHRLTARIADGSMLRLEFEGPGKYFQRIKPAVETATADHGSTEDYFANTTLRLSFGSPVARDDPWFRQMRDTLIGNGFDEITLKAEAVEEDL